MGVTNLTPPAWIDAAAFAPLQPMASGSVFAACDVKYWGGAAQPWRQGTTDAAIEDENMIAREEVRKAEAEAEDAAAGWGGEKLRRCGVRVDWLLALTFELNLWAWPTWKVVSNLVKPATEGHGRCRFADLPFVKPFTGPASVFMSHCWGGLCGDLVVAACQGAKADRIVWIDVFAVRQWPGNGADLDFRGVIAGVTAVIVAAAPVGKALCGGWLPDDFEGKKSTEAIDAYLCSTEFKAAKTVLPFFRLWCIGE